MKRLHIHMAVENLPQSIGFYSALFAAQPAVETLACCTDLYSPPSLNDGQYRALDAYAGVRF